MSTTANWTYTNTATVEPFLGEDLFNGGTSYGEPFDIACTWVTKSEQRQDDRGKEFVSRHVIYTEDARPKYRDRITLNGAAIAEEIRAVTGYDMSFFGESPDFELVT